ncbi:SDR family NAD(P)-dependent oxidoreductase [Parerythrobacter jejuensis]|uniref:SDR family oxidoreductase n=1 Tax=Parerythrobacter jejuensis TaxID=795812 RepID=A0A845APG3_9SPHN|nr:SDR family oxidoreductase [Parerythrobacter jejuensis]MXP31083.1 SDR family oxidoreductase [Parerythrobacter jejuensis]MXP33843.1 SDR family oxidoreductase [Parerythrobacter jejuensis]
MTDPMDFTGKQVLIVGGSSGIGNGMAHAFLARGAEVHVWGTRANASDYGDEPGSDLTGLHYAQVDVSDPDQIDRAPAFDSLDVLICCQGAVQYRRAEFEREGWDQVLAVNVSSVMDCGRKYRAALSAAGGNMIVVSSTAAFHATIGNPAYGASKAAAVALVKNLAAAWAGEGIRVNGIAPGFVATKMTKVTTDNPKRMAGALAKIPLGRMGEPSELAGAALFLASPLSSYVLGQTLVVDGGLTLS